jgi:RHS repeat-associated protein
VLCTGCGYDTITPPGGATGYAANGNLLSYTDWVNGAWSFGAGGYDSLNRLVSGSSGSGPYQGLQMSWSYDSFGNRTSESFGGSPSVSLPTGTTAYYNANNQVTGGALGYDPAGNVTADNANNYLYDGEGRICAVQDRTFGGMTEYIYDAEGTRVAKGTISAWTCDTTQNGFALTNTYVIGPSGEQLTETDGQGNWVHTNVYAAGQLLATYSYIDSSQTTTDTYFALSDWLGTKRAVVSAGGCGTGYVGLPYGGDLTATSLPGFTQCPDATEHHFTGKEHDAESGNDYFGARYYASTTGRFLSPDWSAKEEPVPYAKLDNPQTLNLYSYVQNNPLIRVDADGHSTLAFDAQAHTLTLYTNDGQKVGTWHASNNVDSKARFNNGQKTTPLPNGTYGMADESAPHMHPGQKDRNGDGNMADSPKGEFGKDGIFRLDKSAVNPDGGVGVHAGKEGVPDAAGRTGPDHATNGCVRTTGDGMDAITSTAKSDPLTSITVQNSKAPQPPLLPDNKNHN